MFVLPSLHEDQFQIHAVILMRSTKCELCISIMQNHDKSRLNSLALEFHALELWWVGFLILLSCFFWSYHWKPFSVFKKITPLLFIVSGNLINVMVVANLEVILVVFSLLKIEEVWMLSFWIKSQNLSLVLIIFPICFILISLTPLIQQCWKLLIGNYQMSVLARILSIRLALLVIFSCSFVCIGSFLLVCNILWFLAVYGCEWLLVVCRS